MTLTFQEGWAAAHGMILGALFLLAFGDGLAGLWSYRAELLTSGGIAERVQRLRSGTVVMAGLAWLTVVGRQLHRVSVVPRPFARQPAQPPQG